MEIILKEDIQGLGYKNDIIKVRPGYARNYLIPKGFAIAASESAKKMLTENLKQAAHKAEKIKLEAKTLAEQLLALNLEVEAKVSETGKIFGAVTTTQLADVLKEKHGIEVDRRRISLEQKEIKTVGDYSAIIDLHKEVKPSVKFKVVAG